MKAWGPSVLFCLVCTATQAQQQYVHSVLPNNGAPVLRDYVNPYAEVAMFPVVAVGKFSNATQTVDDIVTVDASGNASCLMNNSDGTFAPPVVTNVVPISALPITAARVVSLPNSTDTLLLASNAGLNGNAGTSTLTELAFNQCKPTITAPNFNQGPILFISSTTGSSSSVLLTFAVCGEISWSLGFELQNAAYGFCATQFWPGPFVFPSAPQTYQDATVIVNRYDAQISSFAPATIAFTSSGGLTNQTPVEGEYFLGFIQTGDGNTVAASSTNNQLFLDQITFVNGEPSITAIGTYSLAGNPVGMTEGNFFNDTENGDLAIASGDTVTILTYAGTAGRPIWSLVETLTASGPIGAIDTGSLVPNGSDIVVQVGTNAEVFSSQSFTEQAPQYTFSVSSSGPGTITQSPLGGSFPQGTSVTLTAVPDAGASLSSWSGACAGQTALTCTVVITTNEVIDVTFASAPATTYTLSVNTNGPGSVSQTPSGTSFASGTVVTLTATPQTGASFSSWSGACQGSQTVCTVTLTSNLNALATFTAAPTPSLAIAPSSATVSAGSSASYAITPQNFSTTPTLTASCPTLSSSKGSCAISNNGQLVTSTTAPTTAMILPFNWYSPPWAPMLLAILVLLALYSIPAPGKRRTAAVGFAAACCLALMACGGGSRPAPTPQIVPGTASGVYTITISATSGSTVVNSSATLKVQ